MGATTFCVSNNALYFFYEVIILDKGVHCSRSHLSANTGFIFEFYYIYLDLNYIYFDLCTTFILIRVLHLF